MVSGYKWVDKLIIMRKHINTQQNLSKRSSKSVVSNVKYMSVTLIARIHLCTTTESAD